MYENIRMNCWLYMKSFYCSCVYGVCTGYSGLVVLVLWKQCPRIFGNEMDKYRMRAFDIY